MLTYFTWAQIVLSVSLSVLLLMQTQGGGLGGIFGQADTVYRTKRGMEKILFQLTIALTVLLIIVSLVMLKLS
jgi:preprotein translocase subunit SecG